jgi:hypothetical protein
MAKKHEAKPLAEAKEAIRYNGAVGTVANQGPLTRPRRWKLDDPEIGTRNIGTGEDEVPLEEAIELVDRGNFEWAPRKSTEAETKATEPAVTAPNAP